MELASSRQLPFAQGALEAGLMVGLALGSYLLIGVHTLLAKGAFWGWGWGRPHHVEAFRFRFPAPNRRKANGQSHVSMPGCRSAGQDAGCGACTMSHYAKGAQQCMPCHAKHVPACPLGLPQTDPDTAPTTKL